MYKLITFVPIKNKEAVKKAMFSAGAGRIGNYDHCCFEVNGLGQFRPLKGSSPVIGQQNTVEQVEEVRIELVCPEDKIKNVLSELYRSHPYEEPAIDLVKLENME